MGIYSYDGPVYHFEKIYSNKWKSYTTANSKEKALSNLKYQAKKQLGFERFAKLDLDKKCLKEEE